jgi:1-acyl-sn-glycerol-3-phosphate acyltransferase
MTLRAILKLIWFLFEVVVILGDYIFTTAFASKKNRTTARAAWLHRACQRHIRIYSCTVSFSGPVPKSGLLVANHLSYLDILVLCSVMPAIFVSKSEVRQWPLFGWLASLGGTLFIQRERRTHVGPINREIAAAMDAGALVVVFPEGTSTNGDDVLPFRSPLLEPVTGGQHPIAVAYLHYEVDGGNARNDVCYWGDHTFFPHAVNLLGKKRVRATVRLGTFQRTTDDRKELAKQLREAVVKLKEVN